MRMWQNTNFKAQMHELEKAGLNPGLIYGMGGGAGGSTSGSGTGGAIPSSVNVGMALQNGMELALLKAQKENIEADTANKISNRNLTDVKTNTEWSALDKLNQEIKTEEQRTLQTMYSAEIARWDANIKANTWEDNVKMVNMSLQKLEAETDKEIKDRAIRNGAWDEYQAAVRADWASKTLQNEATKMGITLQAAQIENMQKQIEIASFNAWTGRWSHRLNVGMAEWKKLMEDVAESTRLKVDVVNGILKGILIGQIAK